MTGAMKVNETSDAMEDVCSGFGSWTSCNKVSEACKHIQRTQAYLGVQRDVFARDKYGNEDGRNGEKREFNIEEWSFSNVHGCRVQRRERIYIAVHVCAPDEHEDPRRMSVRTTAEQGPTEEC